MRALLRSELGLSSTSERAVEGQVKGVETTRHVGEILSTGIRLAIYGPPNAGKSSLLNRLADRSAAIVIFKPGALDPRKLGDALSEKERIVVTVRGATGSNPGLRASPHMYNTMDDLDRFIATIGKYLKTGV